MVTPTRVPIAKNAAQVIAPATRPRRMASGMKGSRAVNSRTANSAHSTTEPPISAQICQDIQR